MNLPRRGVVLGAAAMMAQPVLVGRLIPTSRQTDLVLGRDGTPTG